MNKLAMMAEAYRRGILPPDKVAIFNEARRRGLVPDMQSQAPAAGQPQAPSLAQPRPAPTSLATGILEEGAQGITLGHADELAGLLNSALGRDTYGHTVSQARRG